MEPENWLKEYWSSTYLREMHRVCLQERVNELANNLWSTDAEGRVTPPRDTNKRKGILRLIVHAKAEQLRRQGKRGIKVDERKLRKKASRHYIPPRLKNPFGGSPNCFAKFGKRKHIKPAFERGILRIAPASSYADTSLNPAQADKELEHFTVTPNEHLVMGMIGLDANGKEVEAPIQFKELFRYMMVQDFYVWCCGLGYDARLFHDFEAEAVLVIRDKEAFRSRLAQAFAKVHPASSMTDRGLTYYDPYTSRREQLTPIFSKHFRYLYQNEYRFAWTAPGDEPLAEEIFVDLGPLNDIAEYLELAT
jgi:hypothetical protein